MEYIYYTHELMVESNGTFYPWPPDMVDRVTKIAQLKDYRWEYVDYRSRYDPLYRAHRIEFIFRQPKNTETFPDWIK